MKNIASNLFETKINIELDLDNGTFKLGSRSISSGSYSTVASSIDKVELTLNKTSSKNGNLIYMIENNLLIGFFKLWINFIILCLASILIMSTQS